ncbi:MAG TPA: hypothetical protein G4O00_12690 [Thermoflexia bacterium]|jgi:hypothetical protein|nr:hypothetical protein [Thermoflexia bacterium]
MVREVTDRTKPFSGPFWDHLRAAKKEAVAAFGELLPPSFHEHRRAARREVLLAFRSLIDEALERLEEEAPPSQRIPVKSKPTRKAAESKA